MQPQHQPPRLPFSFFPPSPYFSPPFFNPMLPPPLIPTSHFLPQPQQQTFSTSSSSSRQTIINDGMKTLRDIKVSSDQTLQKTEEDDIKWVEKWLKSKEQAQPNHLTIFDYRQQLLSYVKLLNELDNELTNGQSLEKCQTIKCNIEQISSSIYNETTVKQVKHQLNKRRKKRQRSKNNKVKRLLLKEKTFNEQSNNEKTIDQWLLTVKNSIEKEKLEATLKQTIDNGLIEIRKKIFDIKTAKQTIEQIQRLKNIRRQHRKDTTVRITEDEKLDEMCRLCDERMVTYENEEKQSRLILEAESHQKVNENHKQICDYLFNNNGKFYFESDEEDPYYLYFIQAHKNKVNLLQIRNHWDQYSTENVFIQSNSLPPESVLSKWIMPQFSSDTQWNEYIWTSS
ncbi:unnamed protein product [Didymodactylos carnosus]|uniref:Uncharacterized protein n=1 Tax=Didymodactylos carnosus TaxID=1234261 RepID=A0A813P125_9BILA|nr:unnamed protein product [Didymodactylos carnosus]CAF3526440.1 unnamed protein product [Didymodactylos carnosus]